MSRSLCVFSIAVLGVLLASFSAQAQPPARAGRGMSMSMLLWSPQVQTELKLTDDQKAKVSALAGERGNAKETDKKVAEILQPEQLARLKQIHLQVAGVQGLNSPEVVKALTLTKDQRTKIKALQENVRAKMRSMQGMSGEERMTKMTEIRKENMAKALEILTPAQREQFEKLQGAKFELDFPPPGPPRS